MLIQVLGTGCGACKKMAATVEQAANELELDFEFEKATAIDRIVAAGVIATPALVVDGRVRVVGRGLSLDEAKKILSAD
ncbi:MAG: thioredoxin family protein [Thermoguttaceae bacterium]|nr:thioredoxin family protein [Thermoguttaceae bacterium]MBR5242806.1 thioredoxin family protein [Thermoguttaceae bacterium]